MSKIETSKDWRVEQSADGTFTLHQEVTRTPVTGRGREHRQATYVDRELATKLDRIAIVDLITELATALADATGEDGR